MDGSKHLVLGMKHWRISSWRRASNLEPLTPLFSLDHITMILFLAALTLESAKNLQGWCRRNTRCPWWVNWSFSLDFRFATEEWHLYFTRKILEGLPEEIWSCWMQDHQNSYAYQWFSWCWWERETLRSEEVSVYDRFTLILMCI